MTKEDKAAYATIREAMDLLQYHVECGNLNEEEALLVERADEALAWFENTVEREDPLVPKLTGHSNIDGAPIYDGGLDKDRVEEDLGWAKR